MDAWITLLTRPAYLAGVRTLHQSLKQTQTRYPLVVMVTPDISRPIRDGLAAEGCLVREVTKLLPSARAAGAYAYDRFTEVWSKLCAWRLRDYRRLVLLDADMLALKNMDELFDLDLPEGGIAACHACRCNPNKIASYPNNWVPANCFYTHCHHHGVGPLPENFQPYFNSGTIVLSPDENTYAQLAAWLTDIEDLTEYPFPEQDLLNRYFHGRWRALPYGYNALKTLSVHHQAIWNMQEVKNVHFILDKPWENDPQHQASAGDPYRLLTTLWWQTYVALPS